MTLLFAALSNVSDPPTVHVPATSQNPEFTLSVTTCPSNLLPLFRLWQKTVAPLQEISLDQQADVARLLCDLEPLSQPVTTQMVKLSADLQSIAISISQRQTYLERYTKTLEAGLGGRDGRFKPPPDYGRERSAQTLLAQQDTGSSQHTYSLTYTSVASTHTSVDQVSVLADGTPSDRDSEGIPATADPALISVRETFYSILSEVIERSGVLGNILRDDPARGYYTGRPSIAFDDHSVNSIPSAVALAIVQAAVSCLTPDGQRVRAVSFDGQSASFGTEDAPISFRVFVRAIVSLGKILRELGQKDDDHAIELAMRGEDDLRSLTRIELLKQELEFGAEAGDAGDLSQAAEIRSIANHVRRMASAVTSLSGMSRNQMSDDG